MRALEVYRRQIDRADGKRGILVDQQEKAALDLKDLQRDEKGLEKAQTLIQRVAQETQERLRYHIEDVVQLAIDTCFPDRYKFQAAFVIRRGKTECDLILVDDGHEISPIDATGGGVVDIVSFALRIAGWTLARTSNTIVLDEPFRFLSKELRPRAAAIVHELSERLGLQFLIVTHTEEQIEESDRVFQVRHVDGRSVVEVDGQ